MNYLLLAEVYIALVAVLVSALFAGVAWDWLRDMDAQRRMDALILVEAGRRREADRAPDLFALALEEIRNLPSREHP